MDFIRVECPHENCPYHKSHCFLNEIAEESVRDRPVVLRFKCRYAKAAGPIRQIIVYIPAA